MAKKHDDLYGAVGDAVARQKTVPQQEPVAGEGFFAKRMNALAEMAVGDIVDKRMRLIDPARCKMWERHNRRYELLNEHNCADLIEGFKAQGCQEFPAVVRRLKDDPDHDYEVICGARRHWTVSWLRAHNYPDFKFLIETRALTDEQAFRLADVENRDRADISDYERALDYADALARYYDGKQKAMAERIEVSESWLSRYLSLARLPKAVVDAYGDATAIRLTHLRELNPWLGDPDKRKRVYAAARELAAKQIAARAGTEPPIDGAAVLAAFRAAVQSKRQVAKPTATTYESAGRILLTARRKGRGLTLEIAADADPKSVLDLCRRAIEDHLEIGV